MVLLQLTLPHFLKESFKMSAEFHFGAGKRRISIPSFLKRIEILYILITGYVFSFFGLPSSASVLPVFFGKLASAAQSLEVHIYNLLAFTGKDAANSFFNFRELNIDER